MEQRLSEVDETLIRNPMMMPPTLQTDVPRPKLVKAENEKEESLNSITQTQDTLQR